MPSLGGSEAEAARGSGNREQEVLAGVVIAAAASTKEEREASSETSTLKESRVAGVRSKEKHLSDSNLGYAIVSGDYDGDIKVFYTFTKPKHSSLPSSIIPSQDGI